MSIYSSEEIPGDLIEILKTPRWTPKPETDSFITYVIRPYANAPKRDLSLFSDPITSHQAWLDQYEAFLGRKQDLSNLEIFRFLGISRRAILLNGNEVYKPISDAQATGMLKMLQDGLGEGLDESQKAIIARELANIGRSLTKIELMRSLREFETLYERSTSVWERRHFQVYALQMIVGHNRGLINPDEWYLKGILYRDALLKGINEAADKFLPKFPVAHGGAGREAGGAGSAAEDVEMSYGGARAAAAASLSKQDYLNRLVFKAAKGEWGDEINKLLADLSFADRSLLTDDERNLIDAIRRLNTYHHTGAASAGYDKWIDQNTLNKAAHKLRPVAVVKTPVQRLEEYLNSSQIINYFNDVYDAPQCEKLRETFKNALLYRIGENGGKFPSLQELNTAEQFFWNIFCEGSHLSDDSHLSAENLLEALFKTRFRGTWQDFAEFYKDYDVEEEEDIDSKGNLRSLLPVYQAFPDPTERQDFIDFCKPHLEGLNGNDKIKRVSTLLPVYRVFPEPTARQAFIDFCKPYLEGLNFWRQNETIATLLAVYRAFPNPGERQDFINFCEPHLAGLNGNDKIKRVSTLLPVYRAFPDPIKRQAFIDSSTPYLEGVSLWQDETITALLAAYQALPNPVQRESFKKFVNFFLEGVTPDARARVISSLLPIYQALLDPTERGRFIESIKPFLRTLSHMKKQIL